MRSLLLTPAKPDRASAETGNSRREKSHWIIATSYARTGRETSRRKMGKCLTKVKNAILSALIANPTRLQQHTHSLAAPFSHSAQLSTPAKKSFHEYIRTMTTTLATSPLCDQRNNFPPHPAGCTILDRGDKDLREAQLLPTPHPPRSQKFLG